MRNHTVVIGYGTTGRTAVDAMRGDGIKPSEIVLVDADATVLEVDARWREWQRHNRELSGDDPHVLYTGTVLEVPPHTGHVPPAEDGRP